MPDVFDILRQDHKDVQQMLAKLEGKRPGRDAGEDRLARRKKLTEELIIEESRHEAVEEMYFWPAVREKLPDGGHLADRATGQEQEAKTVLSRLDRLDVSDPEFEELLSEFVSAGRKHIEFEETKVWPKMRKALSKKEASELGKKLKEAKKTAPTRPHPGTPPKPAVLKTVGPATAVADRVLDAATGRGRGGRAAANGKTRAELYQEARRLGVQGRSAMNKEELARRVAQAGRRLSGCHPAGTAGPHPLPVRYRGQRGRPDVAGWVAGRGPALAMVGTDVFEWEAGPRVRGGGEPAAGGPGRGSRRRDNLAA